jgi:hypothetical protein
VRHPLDALVGPARQGRFGPLLLRLGGAGEQQEEQRDEAGHGWIVGAPAVRIAAVKRIKVSQTVRTQPFSDGALGGPTDCFAAVRSDGRIAGSAQSPP